MTEEYDVPRKVMDMWENECDCCHICGQERPCGGVQAGGMCDQMCDCDDREINESCDAFVWDHLMKGKKV